ncbi:hypothetical protein CAOG_02787 [Capsaspora owczarzaki ATCC 30864]|uniref:EGF-like domain-containing protein n=1 Tax=Capsaspora owczarzaki (strain ATCC 30864) TaxID=595528 RepID=A0A0D2U9E9_CAPO3|nr:hypothetical protein CAOG_02787 [Capsaspora owczarzaki ATCC 30864]KJE91686.1 hypothetical protein CAOG_002787 [Capsaspora owczarzaki ATCC 30864]|eukprot:XP_004349540.1 hypothetical protein CAOG_02787 [Capsaspora owczarzaki ATCC 30864]
MSRFAVPAAAVPAAVLHRRVHPQRSLHPHCYSRSSLACMPSLPRAVLLVASVLVLAPALLGLVENASAQTTYYPQTLGGGKCCASVAACYLVPDRGVNLPSNCNGHGSYTRCTGENRKRCVCESGWQGAQCNVRTCPSTSATAPCSGRGTCNTATGVCACNSPFSGSMCQTSSSTIPCPSNCNGHGSCDTSSGTCTCTSPYVGADCSVSEFAVDTVIPEAVAYTGGSTINVYGVNLDNVIVCVDTDGSTTASACSSTPSKQCSITDATCGRITCTMPAVSDSGPYFLVFADTATSFTITRSIFLYGVPATLVAITPDTSSTGNVVTVDTNSANFLDIYRPSFSVVDAQGDLVTQTPGSIVLQARVSPFPFVRQGLTTTLFPQTTPLLSGLVVSLFAFGFQGEPGQTYNVTFNASYTLDSDTFPIAVSPSSILYVVNVCPTPGAVTHATPTNSSGMCPSGFYRSRFSNTTCIATDPSSSCFCNAGYYETTDGCTPCGMNFYKATAGNGLCTACDTRKVTVATASDDASLCLCEAGYYSETPYTPCIQCDEQQVDCSGTSITPRTGFYVSPTQEVYPCLDNNALLGVTVSSSACSKVYDANTSAVVGYCVPGSTGPLCAVCEDGYFRYNVECRECDSENGGPSAGAALVSILMILLIVFVVYTASRERTKLSMIYRLMINFLQITALLGDYRVGWVGVLKGVFGVASAGNFDFTGFSSYQCLLELSYAETYIITLVAPFVIILFLALLYFVYVGLTALPFVPESWRPKDVNPKSQSSAARQLFDKYLGGMLALLFLFHPIISKHTLGWFRCTEIAGEGRFLITDMTVDCDSDYYRSWLAGAITVLVLFCFGVPLAMLAVLIRNRNNLDDVDVKHRYRFMFEGYQPHLYFWELVYIAKRFIIAAIAALYVANPSIQVVLASWAMFVGVLLHVAFKPFTMKIVFHLELVAMIVTFITMLCGIFLNQITSTERDAVDWSLALANIGVFVLFGVVLLIASSRRIFVFIQSNTKSLRHRFQGPKSSEDPDDGDDWFAELRVTQNGGTIRNTTSPSSKRKSHYDMSVMSPSNEVVTFKNGGFDNVDVVMENPWVKSNEL